jgi:hypothetical protein
LQSQFDRIENTDEILIHQVPDPKDPFENSGRFAGREKIRMTDWGPYDYSYPIIWHSNPVEKSDTLKLELIGLDGTWKLKKQKGLRVISAENGKFPSSIWAIKGKGEKVDIDMELEYSGNLGHYTKFGEWIGPKKVIPVRFRKFHLPMNWEVLFFSIDTAHHNPIRTGQLFSMYEKKAPVKTDSTDRLDYAWWGGLKAGENSHVQFLTVASTRAKIDTGFYELSVTWDDAVRVYVDDKLVLDEWEPAKYTFDESPNRRIRLQLGGDHDFRVEHVELGGFATLSLKIQPVK